MRVIMVCQIFFVFSTFTLWTSLATPFLSDKSFEYTGYIWDARPFSEERFRLTDQPMGSVEVMAGCEILCNMNDDCVSFNFSPILKECELLSTDPTLQRLNYDDIASANSAKGWVHRHLGEGKTKGCDPTKPVWGDCVSITDRSTDIQVTLSWTLPGDNLGTGRFLPNCHEIDISDKGGVLEAHSYFSDPFNCDQNSANYSPPGVIEPLEIIIQVKDSNGNTLLLISEDFATSSSASSTMTTIGTTSATTPPGPPSGPTSFSVERSASSNSELKVSWDVSSFNGQEITSLLVTVDPDEGSCNPSGCAKDVDHASGYIKGESASLFSITGLTPGRVYTVSMALVSAGGTSTSVQSSDTPIALLPATFMTPVPTLDANSPSTFGLSINFDVLGEFSLVQANLLAADVALLPITSRSFGTAAQTSVEKAYDEKESTDLSECFVVNSDPNQAWVHFKFNSANTDRVKILTTSESGYSLNDIPINVCNNNDCGYCGTCSGVSPGNWCEITCGHNNIRWVEIKHSTSSFAICEIEIYGKDRLKQLDETFGEKGSVAFNFVDAIPATVYELSVTLKGSPVPGNEAEKVETSDAAIIETYPSMPEFSILAPDSDHIKFIWQDSKYSKTKEVELQVKKNGGLESCKTDGTTLCTSSLQDGTFEVDIASVDSTYSFEARHFYSNQSMTGRIYGEWRTKHFGEISTFNAGTSSSNPFGCSATEVEFDIGSYNLNEYEFDIYASDAMSVFGVYLTTLSDSKGYTIEHNQPNQTLYYYACPKKMSTGASSQCRSFSIRSEGLADTIEVCTKNNNGQGDSSQVTATYTQSGGSSVTCSNILSPRIKRETQCDTITCGASVCFENGVKHTANLVLVSVDQWQVDSVTVRLPLVTLTSNCGDSPKQELTKNCALAVAA